MHRRLRAFLLTLLALGALLLCHYARADTLLHYISETGEYIGNGQEKTLNVTDGAGFTVTGDPRYLLFQIQGGSPAQPERVFVRLRREAARRISFVLPARCD